jgi:predicted ATPase/class 3 adenylate cyclase
MSTRSGPALPTGTLTFLFTDVEGSTRLWGQHPQELRQVMARHDALLTAVFEQHDGVVVRPRGEGDSLFAVFVRASDAVAAALSGQRALATEDWGAVGPLRVRMGLHTGEADLRDGDYYGAAVNRCARIRAAGHGGQVLLSQATAHLVRAGLPTDAMLVDLGQHRLKDLAEPDQLYQVSVTQLRAAFPPLTTLDTHAHNLPLQLTSFVGREQEVAELVALLRDHRLVTLTGPGGTGKTRLALQVAAQAVDAFVHGVWFVDLSGVGDPAGVVPAIAQTFGVRESEDRSLAVSLAAYLRRLQLLLVLDNFEQVVDAALVLHDLRLEAPRLALLVTSRLPLHVAGEREYPVLPLPLPAPTAARAALRHNPAVQLFTARAQALGTGFTLTTENAAAVGELCRRLDGLPLAIELAAARVKLLPPPALLARLDQRLPLLTGGARTAPRRQQTLRNTIQWSWDLLRAEEQVLSRRLSVFAGGWTLAAAEAVCNPAGEVDVLAGLAALLDQSLVQQRAADGEPRFSMLATLQEFAAEQLVASGETEALRRAHAAYYCALAEAAAAAYWADGRVQQHLLQPLDPERDNLVRVLAWAGTQQDATVGLCLAATLGAWFLFRGPAEGLARLAPVLTLPGAEEDRTSLRGRALFAAATCALPLAKVDVALTYLDEAAGIFRAEEDLSWLSMTLAALSAYLPSHETARALALGEEALALARAVGSRYELGLVEHHVGLGLVLRGGDAATRALLEDAVRIARQLDADWLRIAPLNGLATLAQRDGNGAEVRRLRLEARTRGDQFGGLVESTHATISLARLAQEAGDRGEAAVEWRRALRGAHTLGSTVIMATCLAGTAALLAAGRQAAQAVQLLAAADQA